MTKSKPQVKLYDTSVPAGFPSPADNFLHKSLDLNELIVKHPAATFFVKVKGDSMINAGINTGDILAIDRSLDAKDKSIILAYLDGEFTVKRFRQTKDRVYLQPENPNYKIIEIKEDSDFEVWGVVTFIIRAIDVTSSLERGEGE